LSVTPNALLDAPVRLTVSGLTGGARATISAQAIDSLGVTWTSQATFVVPSSGTISPDHDPAIGGDYRGVNGMGLFEFMAPPIGSKAQGTGFTGQPAGYNVKLRVQIGGKTVATGRTKRAISGQVNSTVETLRHTGIYGELFQPKHTSGRRTAILIFGGSEGRFSPLQAEMLAAHGYPALVVAYFDEPGLPQRLSRIPLEYFAGALRLLAHQSDVDPRHIIVSGGSRGSEAALLLGADYPDLVHGVIATSPSSVANPADPDVQDPAWTFGGKPVPGVPIREYNEPDPRDHPQAIIPVEKINGPILLACGGKDRIWHSCAYENAITARLAAHHFAHAVTALHYSGAGHLVGTLQPYVSQYPGSSARYGGTQAVDQRDMVTGYAALLRFLGTA
jgi:dienelactone hydrolase